MADDAAAEEAKRKERRDAFVKLDKSTVAFVLGIAATVIAGVIVACVVSYLNASKVPTTQPTTNANTTKN